MTQFLNRFIAHFKIIGFILLASQTLSAANYNYNKLRFMEYNDLRQIKNSAINASRKFQYPQQAEQTLKPLKETLTMLFSRPNDDNLASSLIGDLESELETLNAFESTIQNIVDDSLKIINDSKMNPETRTTAAICINNLLLEIKPRILKNPNLAKVVCKLADKNVGIPKDIQQDSMYRSLYVEKSPSNIAQTIMKWYAQQKNVKVSNQTSGCPFSKRAI